MLLAVLLDRRLSHSRAACHLHPHSTGLRLADEA
jgi:hypothetical protein